jgi:hypothetical protein
VSLKNLHLPLLLAPLLLVITACATHSQTIRFLEDTKLQIPHLPGTGKVEGRHCANRFLLFAWQTPRIDLAIRNALAVDKRAYNALADAELIYTNSDGFFMGRDCVIVIGRPILLKRPATPAGMISASDAIEGNSEVDWSF